MKIKGILAAGIAATLFLLCGCGGGGNTPGYEYGREQGSSNMLLFSSSDEGLDDFLNDYLHRHLRYDNLRIGDGALGSSVMFNKEWEAMSLMYFDSETSVPDDRYAMIEDWTSNVPVDKYGYTWSNKESLQPEIGAPTTYFGQGWPFPDYALVEGDSQGWEWNDDGMAENWTVKVNDRDTVPSVGGGLISVSNSRMKSVSFTSGDDTHIVPKYSPFLEVDIRMSDNDSIGAESNFTDILVEWQNKKTGDVWHKVKYSEFATIPDPISAKFNKCLYFPMYQNEAWGRSDDSDDAITRIRITPVIREGASINADVKFNYVRGQFDTRQTNNNALLLRAAKMYYEFTGDKEYLQENLPRFRKAAEFLIDVCNGKSGLITMENFFVGHEGATNDDYTGSIGNGYWDIISCAPDGFYTNIYYYKAIESMLYLEKMAKEAGIVAEMPTVKTGDFSSGTEGTATYTQTVESLTALLDTIRAKLQAPLNVEEQTGFWDAEKGRFVEGFNAYGDVIDYGFIMFNLEAVAAGIATDEQAKSIMDWVSGARIVEQDKAAAPGYDDADKEKNYAAGFKGTRVQEDGSFADSGTLGIYDYEFAPRSTTVRNQNQYVFNWGASNEFGGQVQDGGAIMYLSYYDLMSRIDVYGADNGFERLKGIQSWYEKVKKVADDAGIDATNPKNFYREYYAQIGVSMQGGGTAGGIGLDEEFLESALLLAAIPYGFFGIESGADGVLSVAPSLPSQLDWWKMENLRFRSVNYDLSVGENFVQISYVRGKTTGLKIQITLGKASGQKVYIDGVETNDFTEKDGQVTVTVPFKGCKVEVR